MASAGAAADGPVSVSRSTHVDKGARRGDVLLWDCETGKVVVSLGAHQAPSLASALGFKHDTV